MPEAKVISGRGHDLADRDQWPCQGGRQNHTIGTMKAPGSAYMGASDAFTWRMERDPPLRSTIVAVDWLDRAPDWDAHGAARFGSLMRPAVKLQ